MYRSSKECFTCIQMMWLFAEDALPLHSFGLSFCVFVFSADSFAGSLTEQPKQRRSEETYLYRSSKECFTCIQMMWLFAEEALPLHSFGLSFCVFVFSADSFAGSLTDVCSTFDDSVPLFFLVACWITPELHAVLASLLMNVTNIANGGNALSCCFL